ncbi:hypothetical protein JCM10212_000788 [Sporobolomyces blumeae]
MSSTNTAPSLLSRLSPLPIGNATPPSRADPPSNRSQLSRSRETPPHLLGSSPSTPSQRNGGLAIAHAAVRAASGEAAGQAFLSTSSSPNQSQFGPRSGSSVSRSFSSPKKGSWSRSAAAGGAGLASNHLAPLPDEVLQKAQPIPANRSTASSRWASSPPSSSSPTMTTSSRFPSAHPVKKGFSPMLGPTHPTSSSPPALSSVAPSTSLALNQIEAMLSQLRTTPGSSPSHPASISPSGTSPPISSSKIGSGPSPGRPSPFASGREVQASSSPTPAQAPPQPTSQAPEASRSPRKPSTRPPDPVKRPAIGGKSRWARDSDEEPEPVSIPTKSSHETAKVAAVSNLSETKPREAAAAERQAGPVPAPVPPASSIKEAVGINEKSAQTSTSPRRTFAPSLVPLDVPHPSDVQSNDSSSEAVPPSPPSFSPPPPSEPEHHHIDWAEDDADELPDLDDWGVETFPISTTEAEAGVHESEPPVSPTLSSASLPSTRPRHRRRRSSSAKSPPLPASSAQLHAPPSASHHRAAAKGPPPKPTNRIFNSARAAAASGGSASGSAPPAGVAPLARQPPPHQLPKQHQQTPPSLQARPLPPHLAQPKQTPPAPPQAPSAIDSNWRTKGPGPSPALFSKLSGMGGPGAGTGGGGAAGGGGAKSSARRSRGGRSRTSSAANGSNGPEKVAALPQEGKVKGGAFGKGNGGGGGGGGGTQTSRWAA